MQFKWVDLEGRSGALAGWLDSEGLGRGSISPPTRIGGGTQNLMLRFGRDGREYVLRRGPLHLRESSNAAILREVRLLGALAGTDVPHPRLIATCRDEAILGGAVFYLMEPVDGFNATVSLPPAYAADRSFRDRLGLAAVDALVALGEVDHDALGLGDFGNPASFLERQVTRWREELDGYDRYDDYEGPAFPRLEELSGWLEAHRPATFAPGLMHGDFHLANLMFDPAVPRVAAIVDWEMCTVGDPLLDLGWLLATWPGGDAVDAITGAVGAAGDLPSPARLVARYGERSSRDVGAIDWYAVLACFKLAILLEGTYARSRAGLAPAALGGHLREVAVALFARAEARAGTAATA